jgi:hypothetical protein
MLRMLAPGDRGLKAWVVWSLRSQSRLIVCGKDPWLFTVVLCCVENGNVDVELVDVTDYCYWQWLLDSDCFFGYDLCQ